VFSFSTFKPVNFTRLSDFQSSSSSYLFHGYQKGTNPIELATIKQQKSRKKSKKNQKYKVKKTAAVKSSPPTNQHPAFCRPDALRVSPDQQCQEQ